MPDAIPAHRILVAGPQSFPSFAWSRIEEERLWPDRQIPFDAYYQLTMRLSGPPVTRLRLAHDALRSADFTTLRDYYRTVGLDAAFAYTHPDGRTLRMRFAKELEWRFLPPQFYVVEIELEEVPA